MQRGRKLVKRKVSKFFLFKSGDHNVSLQISTGHGSTFKILHKYLQETGIDDDLEDMLHEFKQYEHQLKEVSFVFTRVQFMKMF